METSKTSGTSIEVLSSYLPYNIEVEWYPRGGEPERHLLTELSTGTGGCTIGNMFTVPLRRVLPVLKAFEDLVTPLPDGAVPAEVVAKMAMGWRLPDFPNIQSIEQYTELVKVYFTDTLYAVIEDDFEVQILSNGGRWQTNGMHLINAYLRSQHFALPPLQPSQYIRKSA